MLTTVIAFIPWLFISGFSAEFTRQISWVVILALAFSLIESLLILPAHLAKLKPVEPSSRIAKFQDRIASSIVWFGNVKYGASLERALKTPVITMVVFFAFFIVVTFGIFGDYVRKSFNPEVESSQVNVDIELRDGTTYERALEILDQLQKAQQDLVNEVQANAADDRVVENWYTRSRKDSVIAIMILAPAEERSMSAKEIGLNLRERIGEIAEAKNVSVGYNVDSNGADMDISVRHHDLDQLQLAVDEITEKLREFSSLYDVSNNLDSASEELRFDLKPGAEQ